MTRGDRRVAAVAAALFLASAAGADDGLAVYGSTSVAAIAGAAGDDLGRGGFEAEFRLILESRSDAAISFRSEAGYAYAYGLSSLTAIGYDAGLASPPSSGTLAPDMDLHRAFFIDQAYASAILGIAELRAGVVPISWGASYFYNPTSRSAAPAFPGENLEVRQGKPGVDVSLALPAGISVEGYALCSARPNSPAPDIDELAVETFPFGARAMIQTDYADFSVSMLRVLPAAGAAPEYWYGADLSLSVGDLCCYAEAATTLAVSEASAGLWWNVPVVGADLRCEFIWLGGGEVDSSAYDVAALLGQEKSLLARRYAFVAVEKEDPRAAAWRLTAGALANLDDGSAGVFAEAAWMPVTDFELALFARIFTGSGADELGGTLIPAPGSAFRPYRSAAGLSASWSF